MIVSVGFAGALAHTDWINQHRLPNDAELPVIWCLLAGLVLIIGSWDGYHRHIRKTDEFLPVFIVDIAIVFVYLLLLLLAPNTQLYLWLVAIVFLLYAVWDLMVLWRFQEPRRVKLLMSLIWAAVFIALSNLASIQPLPVHAAAAVLIASLTFRTKALRTVRFTVLFAALAAVPYVWELIGWA